MEREEYNLGLLQGYMSLLKLNKTIERNLLLAQSLEHRLFPSKSTNTNTDINNNNNATKQSSSDQETTEEKTMKQTKTTTGGGKKTKADDLVRVYETLVQNVTEQNELNQSYPPIQPQQSQSLPSPSEIDTTSTSSLIIDEIEAKEIAKQNAASLLSFKALRCMYVGLSFKSNAKWSEATALFDRATDLVFKQ